MASYRSIMALRDDTGRKNQINITHKRENVEWCTEKSLNSNNENNNDEESNQLNNDYEEDNNTEIISSIDNESDFLNSFKPNRNLYFISRHTPLEHHIGALVINNHLAESRQRYHFTGTKTESLTMSSTMIRGPCCDWHHHSKSTCFIQPDQEKLDDPEVLLMLKEAKSQLLKLHPLSSDILVSYEGKYQTVSITEFIVQNQSENGFVQDIRKEIQSQLNNIRLKKRSDKIRYSKSNPESNALDLEAMDLQCMLSCLPEKELTSNPFTGKPYQDSQDSTSFNENKVVFTASLSLFFDSQGNILNPDFWSSQNIQTSQSRLEDLSPKKDVIWLEYTPKYPGSLQLSNATSEDELNPIIESCRKALKELKSNTYSSPLPLLMYLEGEHRFPINYRQRKALKVHYELYRKGKYQYRRSCRLVFDIHDAYHKPPQVVSTSILASRVIIEAELSISESSNLRIIVKDSCHRILDSTECSFETQISEAHQDVIYVSRTGIFERELTLHVKLPESISLRVVNGSFTVC